MREIRFRGKVLQSSSYPEMVGEWVEGYYIEDLHDGELRGFIFNCPTYFMVDPHTVGQFTGLRDKNEYRIYDGDILREPAKNKYENTTYNAFEVFWHDGDRCDGHIGWQMDRMHPQGASAGGFIQFKMKPKHTDKMVIIGNIFDNPKLLEK